MKGTNADGMMALQFHECAEAVQGDETTNCHQDKAGGMEAAVGMAQERGGVDGGGNVGDCQRQVACHNVATVRCSVARVKPARLCLGSGYNGGDAVVMPIPQFLKLREEIVVE